VALALALGRRVPHLVLDEPFSELDPVARGEAVDLLREVVDTSRRTLLVSSHLLSDVDDLCDHVVVLSRGRLTLAGSRSEILAGHPGRSVPEVVLEAMRRAARPARAVRAAGSAAEAEGSAR
jgi:ABC-2 type transport system ATP-binding protein